MTNYLAILRKELHALFVSPIAYVVLAVFFGVSGYFFYIVLSFYVRQAAMRQFGPYPFPMDVPSLVMESYLGVMSTIILFVLPMVTMGIFAEERKRGTMELLLTSPVTYSQLILGKFSAALIFLLVMLVPAVFNVWLLVTYSEPRPSIAPYLIGLLGPFLLGAALLAVGIFISSLTENQIVAAATTFGIFIILWVLDAAAASSTTTWNEVLRYLSVLNHYDDFIRGIFDTQHLVFYLSFVFLGLFLTSLSLESERWRR
ncbi:MAG TPA: ABC transporter permease subunit [Acidobacteriota bacterium]|jgi:ABC-2 type transport system permease protein|nr:ABC transporter permease subunit [Acidobacteriota bacterium]HRR25729.1 ABC transporter permease subunit [Acidobacteriota bacterium]HRR55601.1 ABC transporter permease subunit [Acidobacteriota bacterium]HRV07526.1 ABC transporter permease subunit [Acidobacteriota bacterium]